ncbi:MAG: hypothetical protein R2865_12310 [Deinococcales bacterium]
MVIPESEVVLLGKNSTWQNIGDPSAKISNHDAPWACGNMGHFTCDCVPSEGETHRLARFSLH